MSVLRSALLSVLLATAGVAQAASDVEALSACLQTKSSPAERKELIHWVFDLIAVHPELKAKAKVAPEETERANRAMAATVTRLLTEACRAETSALLKSGGPAAMQQAFQPLGAMAMRELMSNPDVAMASIAYTSMLEREKFESLVK
ncbi:hypothetical protein [Massilia sp. TS11]|uniref:hypothetical protein n=1 Tax=Massilia sp. TS11 TaxID=2908003 RepID=UPI001EDB41B6|nr:hypothetical protein [Massilia sp. TS11]MCG2586227.1 hypothetical protein [Massilia sp. TS11]